MFSMFFFLTQFLQNVLGWSALKTGVGFLPMTLGIITAAVLASRLIGRIGIRIPLLVGPAAAVVGTRTADATHHPQWLRGHRGAAAHRVARHGSLLRALDFDGRLRGAAERGRPRLGPTQHDPAGRRRARPRDPLHDRDRRLQIEARQRRDRHARHGLATGR